MGKDFGTGSDTASTSTAEAGCTTHEQVMRAIDLIPVHWSVEHAAWRLSGIRIDLMLADTGQPAGELALRADHTLTLLTLKPGLFTGEGRMYCGQIWFDDLGIPLPFSDHCERVYEQANELAGPGRSLSIFGRPRPGSGLDMQKSLDLARVTVQTAEAQAMAGSRRPRARTSPASSLREVSWRRQRSCCARRCRPCRPA